MSSATTEVNVLTDVCVLTMVEAAKLPPVAVPKQYDGNVRSETVVAYALLAKMLQTYTEEQYSAADILFTPKGKPYNRLGSYYFSYAHTKDYVACAVSRSEVGLDIEQSRTVPEKLRSKILSTQELQAEVDPLLAWVVKEAYSKFVGKGLGLGFSNYDTQELRNSTNNMVTTNKDYILAVFSADKSSQIARITMEQL